MAKVLDDDKYRLIEMAWQDRTPFEAIYDKYGLTENQVRKEMRSLIKPSSFKRWRKRTKCRKTKHHKKLDIGTIRFQGPW